MQSYERDGFVVFPRLAEAEVGQLVAAYEAMLAEISPTDLYFGNPMTGSMFLGSRDLRKRTNARIGELVGPLVLSVFEKCRFIGAGLRVKLPGPGSKLSLHQDPSVVNEELHWSLNISVALFDATAENGTLQFIPGSHTYMPRFRSLDHSDGVIDIADGLPEQVTTVPLRPGDAIFYANAVLHGSGPNASAEPRPLVLGTVMSPEATMTVFLRDAKQRTRMECFAVPDDYFTDFEDFDRDFEQRPNHKRLDDLLVAAPPSREDVIAAGRAHVANQQSRRASAR